MRSNMKYININLDDTTIFTEEIIMKIDKYNILWSIL